ncbi:hypothetical protein [Telmatospirillum sp.]|uniref:hypothetical protein n=1 Tax=Telmatospirillum sp. TaxID=2079197 RepID=UPI00283FEF56|nr:hypothetical protein [Telmatospirillum sp.]MDR3438043.1 hypothetical protein [Telmatospirillum sp.]
MVKLKVPQVQPSDRFTKVGESHGKIWEVVEVWTAVDGISHVRLRSCDNLGGLITIAAGVLCDLNFWRVVRTAE